MPATPQPRRCLPPHSRLYAWFARGGILCVCCCDCGAVLTGAAEENPMLQEQDHEPA